MLRNPLNAYHKTKLFLLLAAALLSTPLLAQPGDSTQNSLAADSVKADTAPKPTFVSRMKEVGVLETEKSAAKFKASKATLHREALIDAILITNAEAKKFIKDGVDTVRILREQAALNNWFEIAGDGVFTNKGTSQTYRNLSTSGKIISELLERASANKLVLDEFERGLIDFRYRLDSLYSDKDLYDFPDDSAAIMGYINKIKNANYEIGPTDTALEDAIRNVHELQTHVDSTVITFVTSLEEIEYYQAQLSEQVFSKEFSKLGESVGYSRPFSEILRFSIEKDRLSLWFFARNNLPKIFLIFVLMILAYVFIRSLKRILIAENLLDPNYDGQIVFRSPALSAILLILCIFQFVFPYPPFIFNCIFWLTASVALTFIFKNFITRFWLIVWLTCVLFLVFGCANNLILQASRPERWGMFVLSLVGGVLCVVFLWRGERKQLREKLIVYFIGLAAVLELFSAVANFYGRYNLSKAFMISGFTNVVIGILFLWTVRLINEGLSYAARVYRRQDMRLFYINFERVGEKAPNWLYALLILGWFILVGRNFYSFRLITEPAKKFLFDERTIGEYTFSIEKVLVFFLIVAVSVITSRVVSYFATDKTSDSPGNEKGKKVQLGSWLLLIRVTIILLGLFLAFAAAGIPMDRITIILGALGVGVGFGLQTLINNLVSGLIIAFEKPVNVGDVVEIAGKAGIMKSIGFRSSIITTWDGSDVVLPNGDLLNQHLVNWTHGGGKRRMDIPFEIAYGSDFERARGIILNLLEADERVLKFPGPFVQLKYFGDSGIGITAFFWVGQLKDAYSTLSDILAGIHTEFRNQHIEIPFPQQDLHVKTFSNGMPEKSFRDDNDLKGDQEEPSASNT